jgi:hypothetical protein
MSIENWLVGYIYILRKGQQNGKENSVQVRNWQMKVLVI